MAKRMLCGLVVLVGCGSSDAAPDAGIQNDATGFEDAASAVIDAGSVDADCTIGEAQSEATADNLSLFGDPVEFVDGADLPAGTYIIEYIDGCMKYAPGQDWTVNAYEQGGCCHWWVTSGDPANDVVMAPGNVGWSTANGAHASFGECVSASQSLAPVEFEHAGGPIGLRLQDSNFPDNTAGEGGVNPRWRLSTACN